MCARLERLTWCPQASGSASAGTMPGPSVLRAALGACSGGQCRLSWCGNELLGSLRNDMATCLSERDERELTEPKGGENELEI